MFLKVYKPSIPTVSFLKIGKFINLVISFLKKMAQKPILILIRIIQIFLLMKEKKYSILKWILVNKVFYKRVWIIDEIKNITMIKIVKLNITFSQPLFSTVVEERIFDLDSVSPFDWRKIRALNRIERIIWIITSVFFIFSVCFCAELHYKYIKLYQ